MSSSQSPKSGSVSCSWNSRLNGESPAGFGSRLRSDMANIPGAMMKGRKTPLFVLEGSVPAAAEMRVEDLFRGASDGKNGTVFPFTSSHDLQHCSKTFFERATGQLTCSGFIARMQIRVRVNLINVVKSNARGRQIRGRSGKVVARS